MNDWALICTVGGSHQPVVTAIRDTDPLFVIFLCTDRDPATNRPGSRIQVEGTGLVIHARRGDTAPTLPNIPAQCGLADERYEVRIVAADDLDDVFVQARKAIADTRSRLPATTRLLADYTGGTKTMTAGLVMAALECADVELRLVTGTRADLIRVHDGTQGSVLASAAAVRLHQAMAPHLRAWARFGYAEAARGLREIPRPANAALRGEWQIARDLSAAFDAWDRFDHPEALRSLDLYRTRIGKRGGPYFSFLDTLTAPDGDRRREPARLLDLWRNAQRRAAQGRYDDAVARGYRLIEWTAQWLLRERVGIDTADVPEDRIGADVSLTVNRHGKRQAGLFAAWQLVAAHVPGAPAAFASAERGRLLDHLTARNASILAHGYTPIGEEVWVGFREWIEEAFLPMLREAATEAGLRMDPPQLPDKPLWDSLAQ